MIFLLALKQNRKQLANIEEVINNVSIKEILKTDDFGSKRYKILVYPIEDHIVIDTIETEKSELSSGYRVGVKECSPRRDFNEIKDVSDRVKREITIRDYQARYNVSNEEVYFCCSRWLYNYS